MKIEVCGLYKDEEDATMRTFFFARARKPVSFWRENAIAVVILLRVLARIVVVAETRCQMLEVL